MKMHPLLQVTKSKDNGYTARGPVPIRECLNFWARTEANFKIGFDRASRDKVQNHINTQQRTQAMIAAMDMTEHANAEHVKRKAAFVANLEDGKIALDAEFTHSKDSVQHDFQQKVDALNELLRRQIAAAKKDTKALIASVLPSLSDAREKMQQQENDNAENWGTPFEPSYALKLLASQEQFVEALLEDYDEVPEMNPTRSNIACILPPCVGIK